MSEMTLNDFMSGLNTNINRIEEYRLGGDGSDGTCDCIGMIIGAIRLAGGSWEGIHGSNYAARNEMSFLAPITSVNFLSIGDVVYKAKAPGDSGYNLPSRYKSHQDQNDYLHVGVVTRVSPIEITHCTGVPGGIKRDTSKGKWKFYGRLKKVNYGGEQSMSEVQKAIVTASTGSTVKMRAKPSTKENLWWPVPIGAEVLVSAEQGGWSRIAYGDNSGWMLSAFLKKADTEPAPQPEDPTDVWAAIKEIKARLDAHDQALTAMGWSTKDGGFG